MKELVQVIQQVNSIIFSKKMDNTILFTIGEMYQNRNIKWATTGNFLLFQESYNYKDPITEFVKCLHVNFDFDGAQQKLKECEQVLCNDFFLISCYNEFIDHARLMIFETFCRIHQCISIG